jgi:hypothetical protein
MPHAGMSPALPSRSSLTSRGGTSGGRLAPIFQHGTVPISTSAAAEGKEKAKKLAKKAEPQPYGNNLLNYFNPPLGKRPFDQENSPPNFPLKKSPAEPAASDKQQHETSAIGKNINFIDMGDKEEFIDLTGWQCPYLNCHDMNTSMKDNKFGSTQSKKETSAWQ